MSSLYQDDGDDDDVNSNDLSEPFNASSSNNKRKQQRILDPLTHKRYLVYRNRFLYLVAILSLVTLMIMIYPHIQWHEVPVPFIPGTIQLSSGSVRGTEACSDK